MEYLSINGLQLESLQGLEAVVASNLIRPARPQITVTATPKKSTSSTTTTASLSVPTVRVSGLTDKSARLNWTAVRGQNVEFEVATNSAFTQGKKTGFSSTSYVDLFNLAAGTTYYARARRMQSGKNSSAWSQVATLKTQAALVPPTPLAVPVVGAFTSIGQTGLRINWNAISGQSVAWEISTSSTFTLRAGASNELLKSGTSTGSYANVTGLKANTTYYVRLRRTMSGKTPSAWTAIKSVKTAGTAIVTPPKLPSPAKPQVEPKGGAVLPPPAKQTNAVQVIPRPNTHLDTPIKQVIGPVLKPPLKEVKELLSEKVTLLQDKKGELVKPILKVDEPVLLNPTQEVTNKLQEKIAILEAKAAATSEVPKLDPAKYEAPAKAASSNAGKIMGGVAIAGSLIAAVVSAVK